MRLLRIIIKVPISLVIMFLLVKNYKILYYEVQTMRLIQYAQITTFVCIFWSVPSITCNGEILYRLNCVCFPNILYSTSLGYLFFHQIHMDRSFITFLLFYNNSIDKRRFTWLRRVNLLNF